MVQPQILLVASTAAIVTATASMANMQAPQSASVAHQQEHARQSPFFGPPAAIEAVGEPGYIVDAGQEITPEAAQFVVSDLLPQTTAAINDLLSEELLKYLPKPGPMPTTTPHYPTDMPARLQAVLKSEMAKRKTEFQNGLNSKAQSGINYNTIVWSSLVSEIASLQHATGSAGSHLRSLSEASKTEAARLSTASKSLKEKEDEYRHKTRIVKGHGSRKHNAATTLSSSVVLTVSAVAACAFAGLLMVL